MLVSGVLLDAYPGVLGHRYYFTAVAVLAVVGCFVAVSLRRFAVSPDVAGARPLED